MPVYSLSSNITDSSTSADLQQLAKTRLDKLFLNDTSGFRDEIPTLAEVQDSRFGPLYETLENAFGFTIERQTGLFGRQSQAQLAQFREYYGGLSLPRVATLEMASSLLKSSALATLMLNGLISPKESLALSRIEERTQARQYGEIEEFHVFDEVSLMLQIRAAKVIWQLNP